MGSADSVFSTHLNKELSPEELSAEVLKKLKESIDDEPVNAAIITVPAIFGANQKEATLKAAELAGIKQVDLIAEPIAAANVYGLTAEAKDGHWVVFDFGGGTFDAAIVTINKRELKVKDHEGNNFLGGLDIDLGIIKKVLVPKIENSTDLLDLQEKLNSEKIE